MNKKLGIIGCGWLGTHIAKRVSNQYEIFATTTTESKIEDLESKGFNTTLSNFQTNWILK
jgi:Trk K+ transport system NAD-binding subunit